jgi:hypothetical protein
MNRLPSRTVFMAGNSSRAASDFPTYPPAPVLRTGSSISLAGSKDVKTGNCHVTAHNSDVRPVVAVVVDFDGGTRVAVHMMHDHFFKSDDHVAMHGSDFPMSFPCAD